VEVGVPVAEPADSLIDPGGRVVAGAKPAGRYAIAVHHGHPDRIAAAHLELVGWAERTGVPLAKDGPEWGGMFESYLGDPAEQPDPSTWRTELAYLVSERPPR
jgi:effector-binding domain-containing protein